MSNILDYIDWRGDLRFTQAPFNVVDNLIFSEAVYAQLDGIVPSILEEKISIKDAADIFLAEKDFNELEKSNAIAYRGALTLIKMSESARFKDVMMSGYVNEIDLSSEGQFSVTTFTLDDGSVFVAFRGTDDSIVGWKEDFNMSFMYQTAGQMRAVEYLNMFDGVDNIRVGGHSKGGNFSVFASSFCKSDIQDKIIQVYTNDGPGFKKEIMSEKGYKNILPRIISTIPEESIVSMIMNNSFESNVVASSHKGLAQHDALSWQVIGNHFEYLPTTNNKSKTFDKALSDWLTKIPDEERRIFIDAVFSPLEAGGVYKLNDLSNVSFDNISGMFEAVKGLDSTQQGIIKDTISKFLETSVDIVKSKVKSGIDDKKQDKLVANTSK